MSCEAVFLSDFGPFLRGIEKNPLPIHRYFTRTILQFQFAEALCSIAGHQGPLHRCDFSQSKEAGQALAGLLRLGSSKPWPDVLETLTGTR